MGKQSPPSSLELDGGGFRKRAQGESGPLWPAGKIPRSGMSDVARALSVGVVVGS